MITDTSIHRRVAEIAKVLYFFFCVPLRGRKAKKLIYCRGVAESFPFAVLSAAKGKNIPLSDLYVSSEAGGNIIQHNRKALLGSSV